MAFLDEVVPEVRRAVADPAYGAHVPAPDDRPRPSLGAALDRARATGALVVEYKRVSPGQADPILPLRTIPRFVAMTHPWATAYSCLATPPRFSGRPEDVAELARATDRPVLFKDIVVDPRQLEVAARTGASAVLLIARLVDHGLSPADLSKLAQTAHRLGLEVVLEFHRRSELSQGSDVSADVYGVNARDLGSLAIDRAEAETTLREAAALGLRPLLGLSGVGSVADAQRFWNAGADGILVGSSVARSTDPSAFLSTLVRHRPEEDT